MMVLGFALGVGAGSGFFSSTTMGFGGSNSVKEESMTSLPPSIMR